MTENQKAMRRIADELDLIETRAAELVSAEPTDEGDKELRELATKKKTLLRTAGPLSPRSSSRRSSLHRQRVCAGRRDERTHRTAQPGEHWSISLGWDEGRTPGRSGRGIPVGRRMRRAVDSAMTPLKVGNRKSGRTRQRRHREPSGSTWTPIVPAVFAGSVAPFLGITMPRVPSGQYSIPKFNANLTAGSKAKDGAQESTAATFTIGSAKPKRISARLTLRAEDLAEVGIPGFEASLRQNLQMVLSDTVDVQCLRGDGQAPNINGLATQLTDDTAQSQANTFANAATDLTGHLDGKFASKLSELRVIHNAAVYGYLATKFASNDDSVSFVEWADRNGVMQRCNANMKAARLPEGQGQHRGSGRDDGSGCLRRYGCLSDLGKHRNHRSLHRQRFRDAARHPSHPAR